MATWYSLFEIPLIDWQAISDFNWNLRYCYPPPETPRVIAPSRWNVIRFIQRVIKQPCWSARRWKSRT